MYRMRIHGYCVSVRTEWDRLFDTVPRVEQKDTHGREDKIREDSGAEDCCECHGDKNRGYS